MEQQLGAETNQIVDNDYEVISLINGGLNSKVILVEKVTSGEKFAIKMIKNKGILFHLLLSDLKKEIECLTLLKDDINIIKLISYNLEGLISSKKKKKSKKISYLILEYAEKGEIFKYLKQSKGFPLPIAKFYFKQIILGLKKLHKVSIYHRDLKLENILLDKDFNLKIVDFGFSTKNEQDSKILGTDYYMSPEMQNKKEYFSAKCDIFSVGILLFTFIKGSFPFKIASQNDFHYKFFVQNQENYFWKIFRLKFSNDSIVLLNKLLAYDPGKRPSLDEILSSDFLKDNIADKETVTSFMSKIKL